MANSFAKPGVAGENKRASRHKPGCMASLYDGFGVNIFLAKDIAPHQPHGRAIFGGLKRAIGINERNRGDAGTNATI